MAVPAEVNKKDAAMKTLCFALRNNPEKGHLEELINKGNQLCCEEHKSSLNCLMYRNPGVVLKADVVRLLLEKGVNPHVIDHLDFTPFTRALAVGVYETEAILVMIKFLQLHPKRYVGDWADNALFDAIHNPHFRLDAIQLLVDKGCSVQSRNYRNSTPLHLAAMQEHCSNGLVRILTKNNYYKNTRDILDLNPLLTALKWNTNINICKAMFAAGCRLREREQFYNDIKYVIVNFSRERFQFPAFVLYYKQLIQIALLENPNFNTGSIPRDLDNPGLLEFTENCLREIVEMMSLNIADGCTLYEFVIPRTDMYENPIINLNVEALSLVEFMEALSGHHFPVYWELIATNIRRKVLKDALKDTVIYVSIDHASQNGKKFVFGYECALTLFSYLPNVDALNLIFAFRPELRH